MHSIFFWPQLYIRIFEEAENKPISLKKAWKRLVDDLGGEYEQDAIKAKYNQLLSKFKVEYDKCSLTGASSSDWKWYKIFNETYPFKNKMIMKNVMDVGDGKEIKNFYPEEKSNSMSSTKKIKTNNKKDELNEKKMAFYDAMIHAVNKDNNDEIKEIKNDINDIKNLLNEFLKKK